MKFLIVPIILAIFLQSGPAAAADTINVAVMINSEKEAQSYDNVIAQFHQTHPDIKVNLQFFSDRKYKSSLSQWLIENRFDLFYWQAGRQRLLQLAKQGLLADMSEIWQHNDLDNSYPRNITPLVTYDNKKIAIPYSYYHWGIFYNTELFAKLQLSQPETLPELYEVCDRLAENNIVPVAIGLQHRWPVLSWFSYLALRLEGYHFYNQFMDGQISWTDKKVVSIMQNWKTLLQHCYINTDALSTTLAFSVRSVLRSKAGMILTGNFTQHRLTNEDISKLNFFPFPEVRKNTQRVEFAPVEVWIMPLNAKNKAQAKTFLNFFLQPAILDTFNRRIDYFSPYKSFKDDHQVLSRQGIQLLQSADELIQYFDRDTHKQMVTSAETAFIQFIADGDIDAALKQLEEDRLLLQAENP